MPDNPPGAPSSTTPDLAQRLVVVEAALKANIAALARLAERLEVIDKWREGEEKIKEFKAKEYRFMAEARYNLARELGLDSVDDLQVVKAQLQAIKQQTTSAPTQTPSVSLTQWYADLSPTAQKTLHGVIGLIVTVAMYLLGYSTAPAPQQLQPPPSTAPAPDPAPLPMGDHPTQPPSVIPTHAPPSVTRRRPAQEGEP